MSIAKVRAAIDGTKETNVKVSAGDLLAACEEAGDKAKELGAVAKWAVEHGKDKADTSIQIHREAHGKLFPAPATTPGA